MSIKKKIIVNSLTPSKLNKPDTITRAGITANLKFTRGKQLVEHIPSALIPDPSNPRPGEIVDEIWLKTNLFLGTEQSLCHLCKQTGEYIIPEYSQLNCASNSSLEEESYNFLRDLAFSIRTEGLIEPIEIFLTDRINDPNYFINSDLEYGYVILEGHQRRLAAMMAGVATVTCIEITDESMLVKLKVKHRKIRRQLSENNLRKGLTVAQNFQIVQELLSDSNVQSLTNKELSNIIGLNVDIASALKSICMNPSNYPSAFISRIKDNKLTFKMIRILVAKTYNEIESILHHETELVKSSTTKSAKPRGKQGGAVKRSAIFKVGNQNESNSLQQLLLSRFPEIKYVENEEGIFKGLENLLHKIKEMAIKAVV